MLGIPEPQRQSSESNVLRGNRPTSSLTISTFGPPTLPSPLLQPDGLVLGRRWRLAAAALLMVALGRRAISGTPLHRATRVSTITPLHGAAD